MKLFTFIILLSVSSILFPQKNTLILEIADDYPRWLTSDSLRTDQTSGITYIGNGSSFLLADDIGELHRFTIEKDTLFTLYKIGFSNEVKSFLSGFPKKDFEEILFDKHTGKVLLSIEGNKPEVKTTAGIYEIKFLNDNLLSDSIVFIEKLMIQPQEEFLKYVTHNIGFEGLAADSRYYYAGLEGFSDGILFADSTLLYIIDKSTLQIKKILSTKSLGIATICGLYSDKELSFYGIDRNNRTLFHITLNDELEIENIKTGNIPAMIPNYKSFDYVAAFESLTFDSYGFLYIVDDPWKTFYVPPSDVLSQLDEITIRNFKQFIPVIYKFKLIH
jgi:hypothetical protein